MADFLTAWNKTSKNEGGFVNNSKDKGKMTYRGISSFFFPAWEGWGIVIDTIKELGIEETLDCSKEVRKQIDEALSKVTILDGMVRTFYKTKFWDALNLDAEQSQLIADEIFDTAVNMGVGTAKKMYKDATNA